MRIYEWPFGSSEKLKEAFVREGIHYDQDAYSGLLSPSSVVITDATAQQIANDIQEVWSWSRRCVALYASLLEERQFEDTLVQACEWSLTPTAIQLQRESSILGEEPGIGRLDSVAIDRLHVAEVQWKGGGEGFFSLIDEQYRATFQLAEGHRALGDMCKNWKHAFLGENEDRDLCVLNTGRDVWMDCDKKLAERLREQGVILKSLPPSNVAFHLKTLADAVYLETEEGDRKLDYLYLDRLTEVLPEETLKKIIQASREGKIRIDPPPSYLFNQKTSLALPFMDEYRTLFSDRIREILIPTVLISDRHPALAVIAEHIDHPKRDLLQTVEKWEDLLRLPRSLREMLVFKCASAHRHDNHGGHGVFRFYSKEILYRILQRVREGKEPWIVQPYVSETWDMQFSHPDKPEEMQKRRAHARFGIYCAPQSTQPLLGGIATVSPFWKVGGKSASYDASNRLCGSAFTDIRVETF